MLIKSFLKTLSVSALFASHLAFSAEIPLLNHNFDSDAIPPAPGYTTHISGWVNSGYGEIGVWAPTSGGNIFHNMGERGQIAYVNSSGRISQTINLSLLEGETYTLTFDVGRPLTPVSYTHLRAHETV